MHEKPQTTPVRLDRWLWAARLFRSRSLAAAGCEGGKAEVNGQRAKPHRLVRVGDLIEVTTVGGRRRLRVRGTAERRGPAAAARELYEDLTPPPPPREERVEPPARRARGAGRPTKRERRQLERFLR